MSNVNVITTKLYKVRKNLPREEMVIILAAGIKRGQILWCEGNRKALTGEYIGNFYAAYESPRGLFHPDTSRRFPNMPMRYFQEVY